MPGSIREYTYTVKPRVPEDLKRLSKQARSVMGWACDGDKRITCYGVTGDPFGVIQLNFTIRARDQWYSRELAQEMINIITWGLRQPAELDLNSVRLPPHLNRGYAHGRTKPWRARSSSSLT